jgi:hypothetical protein
MSKNCTDSKKFSSALSSTKAYLRTKGVIDKYLNIVDLPKYRAYHTAWKNDAAKRFGLDTMLFTNEGNKAIFYEDAFREIDRRKASLESALNESEDFIIPTGAAQVTAVENKRQALLEKEVIKIKEQLKTEKDPSNIRKLYTQLDKAANLVVDAKERVSDSKNINAFEEVLAEADSQLKEVSRILSKPNLSFDEIFYAKRVLDLWKAAGDFSGDPKMHIILTEDEVNTPEIKADFRLRKSEAEDLSSILDKVQKDAVVDFVRQHTVDTLSEDEIFKLISDTSKVNALMSNIGRHDVPILTAIFSAVQQANIKAQLEANDIWENLDSLGEKVLKKLGNNFNIFKQLTETGKETGRLVTRFSDDFFSTRNGLIQTAFHTVDPKTKQLKKNPDAVKNYFDWVNKNTITFDPRILFADELLVEGTMPDKYLFNKSTFTEAQKEAHIAELKAQLGEKGYQFYLDRVEAKLEKFRVQRESAWEDIQENDSLSETEKEVLFENWLKENSPYWGMAMQEDVELRKKGTSGFYAPIGIRNFTEQVPRRTVENKGTKWYDKNFEKIEADSDLLAFYNYTLTTLNSLNYMLPSNKQAIMKLGVIPSISKNIMDIFSEKGIMMGITPFFDKLKQLQTTTDLATEITSDVNPLTGAIEKNFNLEMIQDVEKKVRDIVKVKRIAYEQSTGKVATSVEIKKFKAEARDELSKEKSWDLIKIMKAYSLMTLAYKHKSFIEPQIKMAQDIIRNQKEVVTNKAGQAKTKNGVVATEKSLNNYISSLEYFLDSDYWNIGGRKIEGVTSKKLYTSAENAKKRELEGLLENATDDATKKDLVEEIDKLGGYRTGSGTGDAVLKFMTLKGLGWNLGSAFSNLGFGIISNIVQASDGREYSMKNMRKAYILAMNSVGKNLSFDTFKGVDQTALKIRTLMDKYDFLKTSNKELFETSAKSSFDKLKRFGPYSLQERTEYMNQAPVMIATMLEMKAKNPNGETVTLWDAYDSEGNLKDGFTTDINEIQMVQKIKRIIEMNHGDYANPLEAKATFAGRALTQFRTWMGEGFKNRFESAKTDYILGYGSDEPYIRKGRYRSYTKGQLTTTGALVGSTILPGVGTLVGAGVGYLGGKFFGMQTDENAFSDVTFTLRQLARKLMFKSTEFDTKFSKEDAANMRKNMTELYMMMALAGVAVLIKGAIGDDDEEDSKIANFLLNQNTRLQTDILFYTNPLEFEKLTKTAMPLARLLQEANTWRKDVQVFLDGEADKEVFESGPFKGDSKFWVHTAELIPGTSQLVKLYRQGSKIIE